MSLFARVSEWALGDDDGTPGSFPPPEARRFLELAPNGILIVDLAKPDWPVCYVNATFEQITGYNRGEAVGRNCRYLQGNDHEQPAVSTMRNAVMARRGVIVTLRNYRKDGRLFWNELKLTPLCDQHGVATHYLGVMRDVTELKATRDQLEFAANTDRLTGCLNLYSLTDWLTQASQIAGQRSVLIKIDVIRFDLINSAYGHDAGDAMLTQIAGRLQRIGADAVARIGSNEFGIAFKLTPDEDGRDRVARVQDALALRYTLPGGTTAPIDASFAIGFVVGEPGEDGMTLLRRAGTAVSQSKTEKMRGPREFDSAAANVAEQRLRLTSELQQGVANGEFCYHYQPKIDLWTGEIVGAEALLRWQHPTDGLRLPASFIDLAEETGLLIEIGTAGFREVAMFIGEVNRLRHEPLNIAVNVSATMFRQPDIVKRAAGVLADTGVEPAWVTIEITESLMADHSSEVVETFRTLRDLGFGLSIDDFGTGYSSLGYLERFPISEIKIDQSFVRGIIAQPSKRFVVDAVVKIGSSLGASVVAEGVETEEEAELLRELGCTTAQGYLYGRPMPAEEFVKLVRT